MTRNNFLHDKKYFSSRQEIFFFMKRICESNRLMQDKVEF